MIIEDGKGSGRTALVDSENRIVTFSVQEPHDRHLNRDENKVWSLPFQAIDPVGADDYFIYIKNTGTVNLAITDIRLESTVAGTVEVHHVTGTKGDTAAATITPVNRFLGSSLQPSATCETDTNATGLTSAGIVFMLDCLTPGQQYHLSTSANIFIPPGQAVALLWDTSTGALSGVISLVEVGDRF